MDPAQLANVLQTGAALALPVKAAVDVVKRSYDPPAWVLVAAAGALAQLFCWLLLVYSGGPITPAAMAGATLAGFGATGAAIASTELHNSARSAPEPASAEEIAGAIEARREARVMARLHELGEGASSRSTPAPPTPEWPGSSRSAGPAPATSSERNG